MSKKRIERGNNKIFWFFTILMIFLFVVYFLSNTYNTSSKVVICDYFLENVSNGSISLKFLLDKAQDYDEVVRFCKSKGYDGGVLSSSISIYCGDDSRYKYFSIMKDFAEYIYEEYG